MLGFGKTGSVNINEKVFVILSQRVSFFSILKENIKRVISPTYTSIGCLLHKSVCVLKFLSSLKWRIAIASNCSYYFNKRDIINSKTFGLTIFLHKLPYSIRKGKGELWNET